MNNEREIAGKLLNFIPRLGAEIRRTIEWRTDGELTLAQFRILVQLLERPLGNQELADRQGLNFSTVSRMVDALVKRGWVTREASACDRRKLALGLTAEGRRIGESVKDEVVNLVAGKIALLSSEDRARLACGLELLPRLFEESGEEKAREIGRESRVSSLNSPVNTAIC